MIRVIFDPTPAGSFWLEYSPEDAWAVVHFLSGRHWSPSPKEVKGFAALCRMHGVYIDVPNELDAIP